MPLNNNEILQFRKLVWGYYNAHSRQMPWREKIDPYFIVVSEIMLQQTQVDRVRPKFTAFISQFPTVVSLAQAPLSKVLTQWVGLGYNRRARYLHLLAKEVVARYNGRFPQDPAELATLPGIGPNTAGAIAAYAFNMSVTFVETNVRTVLLHHFFAGQENIDDRALRSVAEQVLDSNRPREWHWALMDYGTYLKKLHGNNIRRAKAYRKQSVFKGSLRQVRGKIIALLVAAPHQREELMRIIGDDRTPRVLAELSAEKLIIQTDNRVQLAE